MKSSNPHEKLAVLARVVLGAVLISGSAIALGAEQAPNEQMALARAAIEQAQSAGATESAPVELKAAQDRFNQATAVVAKERRKDYPQARRLAEESESSARLATSMATAAKAEQALAEVNKSIEVMRQEMQRPAP